MISNYPEVIKIGQKERCELSLKHFIKNFWHVLEPGRSLVDGRVIDAICDHLEAVSDGHIKKLLINVPPGTMKSSITNVFWPAWELGPRYEPWKRFISISYSHGLTRRDNRKSKAVIQSELFQKYWPHVKIAKDEDNVNKFRTTAAGFRIASSIRSPVLGERGDRLILDDPNNIIRVEGRAEIYAVIQFISEVMPTRINDPETSAIVIIMQRLHEYDASGHVIACDLGFEHLMLPMFFEQARKCKTSIGFEDWRTEEGELLWAERFSKKYLEEDLIKTLRSQGGEYAEAGQLQQRPIPREGGMFKRDELEIVPLHELPVGGKRVRAWDLAATSKQQNPNAAYTTGVLMRRCEPLWIIENVVRKQVSESQVERFVKETAERDGYEVDISIPQDPGAAGKAWKASFASNLAGYNVRFSPETGAKQHRAIPLSAQAEAGMLKIVKAPWNTAYIDEVCLFPNSKLLDQVDASSRGFHYLLKFGTHSSIVIPQVVGIKENVA